MSAMLQFLRVPLVRSFRPLYCQKLIEFMVDDGRNLHDQLEEAEAEASWDVVGLVLRSRVGTLNEMLNSWAGVIAA